MKLDLHIHTKFSDGSLGIDEVVMLAKKKGSRIISVTDYDTFAGSIRASVLGKKFDIEVILGAEVTAFDSKTNKRVNLLCYLPEHPNRMEGLFKKNSDERKRIVSITMQKIMMIYPIVPEMVIKRAQGSTNIFKSHILHALVDAGYDTKIYGDLEKRLFAHKTGLAICKENYPDVRDVLKQIQISAGVSVLARPGLFDSKDLIKELSSKGLDGIEVYHPDYSKEKEEEFLEIADEYNLIKIGGTDFKGMYSRNVNPIISKGTPLEQVKKLKCIASKKGMSLPFKEVISETHL